MIVNFFKDSGYLGEIGVVYLLEIKYFVSDLEEDCYVCFLDDVLLVRFFLDVIYFGYYFEEIMCVLDEICEVNGVLYEFVDSDFDVMKKVLMCNDYFGINYY